MGWSIDTMKPGLDAIFANLNKQYTIFHVEATQPTIMIKHEGEIPVTVMKTIVGFFPEFVYVNFVPNTTFPVGQSIVETH